MTALRIENLCVRLGGRAVIEDLSLEVDTGEFLVLLGPSGCGKSTLLHTVAGLQESAAGRVLIDGVDRTWSDPAERNIGMVFQSYALYPTMTVHGNMSFGLRARGLAGAEVRARVQRVAELLQLGSLLGRKPAQLSGGQRQRVAIGRALVRDAGLFLLDEPLSNLDAGLRASLRRELKLLHQRIGATMIYVTHDQIPARRGLRAAGQSLRGRFHRFARNEFSRGEVCAAWGRAALPGVRSGARSQRSPPGRPAAR